MLPLILSQSVDRKGVLPLTPQARAALQEKHPAVQPVHASASALINKELPEVNLIIYEAATGDVVH